MGLSSKEVSGDSLDWSQIGSLEIPKPIGEARSRQEQEDQRQKVPPLKCPRCESTNTKFCYYNNYSRSQPRHFCRACRRHWTEGGTLRNVPVGGNRKNKRTKTSHTTTISEDDSIGISTIHQQQQQQKVAAPLGVELENSIFPDILRQVFFHPPPTPSLLPSDYSGNNSLFSPSPFLPEIGGIEPVCDDVGNPFSISTSPSCSSPYRGPDLVGTMMGGSSASTWLQEPSALPASYWNCWDGNTDFAAADRSPDDS